jgi:hypothetical protein
VQLHAGSSLRQSIDLGLSKSRHGIVVLSPYFFGKSWPGWELDGLVQRQLSGSQRVLLPVWHNVGKADVAEYSPSLADIVAIPSSLGLCQVVKRLLAVIQPKGSALVTARNLILDRGYEPRVVFPHGRQIPRRTQMRSCWSSWAWRSRRPWPMIVSSWQRAQARQEMQRHYPVSMLSLVSGSAIKRITAGGKARR